jgi:peptide/nickel transport system permease protein
MQERPTGSTRPGETVAGWVTLIGQRLAFGLLVLLSLIYLTHLGLDMARGTSFTVALARALTKSVMYLSGVFQGDLGLTAAGTVIGHPTPIAEVVPDLLTKSLGLLAVSLLFATLVGAIFGLVAARYRYAGLSSLIILGSIVGISVPSFFLAPMLQMLLARWARQFGEPLLPAGGFGWDTRIILPALVLAARPVAQIARVAFVSLGEVMDRDFIRVAHSKGLRPVVVLLEHITPNVAIPVLTTVGLSLRFSLSSLPVVEYFFGWPGVGFTLLKAIARRDDNLAVALILCLGLIFIGVNLLLEIVYRRIDPRLRENTGQVGQGRSEPLLARLKDFLSDILAALTDTFRRWFQPRQDVASRAIPLETQKPSTRVSSADDKHIAAERRRALWRATLGNFPFVLGTLIVLGLLGVVFFGPSLSPHSPYTTQGLLIEDGEFMVPPFAPNNTHPWGTDVLGRDLMSLILSGAQQTFVLAVVVVAVRMVIGTGLGLLAGWQNGSWFDRLTLSLAEIISAFPVLLLAMILILALGIRQGLKPFIIALCFVGWGEVMQFTRSQMIETRPKLFIESAVSIGLRTPRIIGGHVLPNLLPALISIAALEMGAVLILLGELGFIGIFIGGGSLAEVPRVGGVYHYSDVPEWGALLSNLRTYARAYAWTAIYPTSAFFLAILGFNLFGEGMRRLVDEVGVRVTRVVNRYTVAVVLVAVLGFSWVQQYTGSLVFYRQQAYTFAGQNALTYIQHLTAPALTGRALDTPGLALAADYIAGEFESLGLQPAGQKLTYFYERSRSFQRLDAVPQLSLVDDGPPPVYLQDFTTFPSLHRNLGQARGRIRFITTGPLTESRGFGGTPPFVLRERDYRDEILLVLTEQDVANLVQIPHAGILVVAHNEASTEASAEVEIKRNRTLFNRDPIHFMFGTNRQIGQDLPKLWITEAIADRILRGTGYTVADLRLQAEGLLKDQIIELETPATATMVVEGTVVSKTPTAHVIGHLPGTMGITERTGLLNSQMIMVIAPYDSPPPNPDGLPRPAANDNASGVAVMLEVIRAMQESGYQPYKTFLFVAYSAEGMEGGEIVAAPDPGKLLQARSSFGNAFEVEAVVHLRGLGAGQGDGLALSTSGSQRLASLFEAAADQVGVSTTRVDEAVDLSMVFDNNPLRGGQEAPQIVISWAGWQATSGTPADTVDAISVDNLEKAGRALSLALMILGRETQY